MFIFRRYYATLGDALSVDTDRRNSMANNAEIARKEPR